MGGLVYENEGASPWDGRPDARRKPWKGDRGQTCAISAVPNTRCCQRRILNIEGAGARVAAPQMVGNPLRAPHV